jgi:hypothetical protein
MQLKQVPTVDTIDPEVFKKEFYEPCLPVVIKNLSKDWPAYTKWNWDYFKQLVGDKRVPLYNNVKSDAYTPINTADDYKTFGEYIDMISRGPAAWRIFLFNIFDHAPELTRDFTWPSACPPPMAAPTAPQRSWPTTMTQRTPRWATAYSKLPRA